mgnify:FL=1
MKHILKFYLNLNYKRKIVLTCILVGLIPLTTLGTFCYSQTVRLLREKEQDSMSASINTAYNSLNHEIQLYEDQLSYLTNLDTMIQVASGSYDTAVEKFDVLNYTYDVLLSSIYAQQPEISQITLYVDRDDLFHGKQLRPLSDLASEPWYDSLSEAIRPVWHLDKDGYICMIQRLPNPYIKFISSYSNHCLCIRMTPSHFFQVLDGLSTDYHLQIGTEEEVFFDYTDPTIEDSGNAYDDWTSQTSDRLDNGWQILLEKPSSLLAAPADEMVFIIFLVVLICCVLIFTVSNLLSGFFAQKVNRLLQVMQEVKKGNLSVRIHDNCPDEIGKLTNSFQEMIEKLNQLITENYQNKITLKETQLLALQAQIHPHFLYNCLSLINSKALINHQPEISEMAQLLSTFYRTSLNRGQSEALLTDEIKNVQSYIKIQLLLNDNSFRVVYQIDPQPPDQKIPNLLLQPLVENAIVHGILPNKAKHGTLYLTITRVNDQIHFIIMDNGLGIPKEKIPSLTQTQSDGYGLKNVQERLKLTYGEEYGLTINSIVNESTMVTFTIPIRPA